VQVEHHPVDAVGHERPEPDGPGGAGDLAIDRTLRHEVGREVGIALRGDAGGDGSGGVVGRGRELGEEGAGLLTQLRAQRVELVVPDAAGR
jgi:hypothetical protein